MWMMLGLLAAGLGALSLTSAPPLTPVQRFQNSQDALLAAVNVVLREMMYPGCVSRASIQALQRAANAHMGAAAALSATYIPPPYYPLREDGIADSDTVAGFLELTGGQFVAC